MKSIKEVRSSLRVWGNFWETKRLGKGFSNSCSILNIATGDRPYTEDIFVPRHVDDLDIRIDNLSIEFRDVLKKIYIQKINPKTTKNVKLFKHRLLKAEHSLISSYELD